MIFFFFKQKTAYEVKECDWSSDVCSSDLDYKKLVNIAVAAAPPGRAKVHLAKYADDKFVTALIYPAEYNEEFSDWLSKAGYKTPGPAEGGIEAVKRYYDADVRILQRHQLFSEPAVTNRSGSELVAATKQAVQR